MSANSHAGHGMKICEFGTVHSRCRCPQGGTSRMWVLCPTPDECQKSLGNAAAYAPKHRKDVRNGRFETRIDP